MWDYSVFHPINFYIFKQIYENIFSFMCVRLSVLGVFPHFFHLQKSSSKVKLKFHLILQSSLIALG